jgi:uncharacterized protein (TIGR02569 family)
MPLRRTRFGRLRDARRHFARGLFQGTIAWPVRLVSWALVAIPVALLFGPVWIPVAIAGVEFAWIIGMHWSGFRLRGRQRALEAQRAEERRFVFAAFGVVATGEMLFQRGSGAWRAGDLVFKAAPSIEEWSWLGEHLPTIREDGFRLALPVPALDGRWVVEQWCAQTWLAGSHQGWDRWIDVLALCERFHRASAHLPQPSFIEDRTHPWAVGDRVAWAEAEPPTPDPWLEQLIALRRPISLPSQLMHGDLTDNVLFDYELAPAIIDPTPYWRPAGFASAIVVHDAVAWWSADPVPLIGATAHLDEFPQLFVRAAIYRMVTGIVMGSGNPDTRREIVDLATWLAG